MCKISVIMPTYNAEAYLREAIDSILNQTFTDFEFLIIDDCSTDETRKIIESYLDKRIKLIDGPQRGISAALNVGLAAAEGTYIARMDADDISLPERFEKQVAYLDANPAVGVCGTQAEHLFMDGRPARIWGLPRVYELETPGLMDQLLSTAVVCHPTVMFRKSMLDQYHLQYNEFYRVTEDQELWMRALRYVEFYNIQEVLLLYRTHVSNATSAKSQDGKKILLSLKIDLLKWLFPSGNYDERTDIEKQVGWVSEILKKGKAWDQLVTVNSKLEQVRLKMSPQEEVCRMYEAGNLGFSYIVKYLLAWGKFKLRLLRRTSSDSR